VKLETYSSLAAFLAHWRTLARAGALEAGERARLAAMRELVARLRPEEQAALAAPAADGASARHRERAELRLARELRIRGLLAP
jgi:hypothetical protein